MPEASLDELMREMAWVRRLARSLVHDEAAADDIAHDAYLAARDKLPADDRPLRPWLHRVVLNVVRMRHRSSTRRGARELATAADDRVPTADDLVERMETQRALADAVLALVEPYRSTILLHYVEGLSSADIARRLDVPAATVRQRLKTALDQLRTRLRERDRRGWMAALIPLARGPATKAVVMKKSLALAIAVIALLLIGGGIVYKLVRTPDRSTSTLSANPVNTTTFTRLATPIGGKQVELPAWLAQKNVKGRRLAGHVVFDGKPVAGASVRLGILLSYPHALPSVNTGGAPYAPVGKVATNAAGEFDFGVVPPVNFVVSADAEGHAPTSIGVSISNPKTDTEHVTLVLGECRTRVVGTVRDSASPVAHARLAVAGVSGTESDAKGMFTLCMPVTEYPNIRVDADGYSSINIQVPAVAGELHRDIVLVPEATISGIVVDDRGAAVPGAVVAARPELSDAQDDASFVETIANEEGHFELLRLAPSKFQVMAIAADGRSDAKTVTTKAGTSTRDLKLTIQASSQLVGHVMMKGQPIAGAYVGVDKGIYRRYSSMYAESQPDGAFVLDRVPRGKQTLDAYPYEIVSAKTIDIDKPTVDVTIEVSALGSLRGKVTRHGVAVPNAHVEIRPINATAMADENGDYVVEGLPAGQYIANATDYKAFTNQPTHLEAAEQKHLDLELDGGGEIVGTVVDQNGKPEVGVVVHFDADNDQCSALTDANGSYSCVTLTGKLDYKASVYATSGATEQGTSGHPFKPVGSYPTIHVDDGNAVVRGVKIAIDDEQLSIRGRVVDDTGNPVSDARVSTGAQMWGDSERTRTDDTGAFVITRLASGHYAIRARTSEGGVGQADANAGDSNVTLVVSRTGTIAGTLVGFASTNGVLVMAAMQTRAEPDQHDADITGDAFTITGVRAGSYVVQAVRDGSAIDLATVDVKAGATATVTLHDQPRATITGRVLDLTTGSGVAGLACRGMPSSGGRTGPVPGSSIAKQLTDASGGYSVDVPIGHARVECYTMDPGDHSDTGAELDAGSGANHVDLKSVKAVTPGSPLPVIFEPSIVPPTIASVDPSANTGFRAGDTITAVDGLDVHATLAGFVGMLLANHRSGSAVELSITRDGKPLAIHYTTP
ncbi:MAG: sigma-70 family RNA polymerase sigma factor [Kofleriaceae bacterium]